MTRYDICTPRPRKDGKTYWLKIGAMFPDDKGGFSILLDANPLPDSDGKLMVKAFPAKDRDGQQGQPQQGGGGGYSGPDDSIPFMREDR